MNSDAPPDEADIDALLSMAALEVSPQTRTELKRDLVNMVRFVDVLKSVDIEGVPPMVHPGATDDAQVTLRADEAQEVLGRAALKDSPHFDGTFIRVPKVIE